jgi:hypothetical protein
VADDGTLGPGRRRDHLRMSVDFGDVCRRCGARLLDEPATVLMVAMGRRVLLGSVDTLGTQERRVVLCDRCADRVWAPLETRFLELLARAEPFPKARRTLEPQEGDGA